ncbi:hypothetical protein [Longispora fulva]|uniref:Uncharacterized protein n=1 Tax=Longispora fulva TaxID=619741 RepID=A0A8J7GIJ4_9ACTN|nr:hypothetical protein [Longispora fulva]MBG6137225.1 hypothetical protein [Longispora fulva]
MTIPDEDEAIKKHPWHKRLRSWVAKLFRNHLDAVLLVVAGIAFFAVGIWRSPTGLGEAIAIAVLTFGSTLIVGAILGGIVESRAHRRYRDEITKGVIAAVYGPHAPPAYRKAIGDFFTSIDRCSLQADWGIKFSWIGDEKSAVQLDIAMIQTGLNISDEPYCFEDIGLVASLMGHHSAFQRFRLQLLSEHDGHASPAIRPNPEELRRITIERPDGTVGLKIANLGADANIPAGAKYLFELEASVVLPVHGSFPTRTKGAHLHQTIIVEGEPLRSLNFELIHRGMPVVPKQRRPTTRPTHYEYELSPTFPGAMPLLMWSPSAEHDGH